MGALTGEDFSTVVISARDKIDEAVVRDSVAFAMIAAGFNTLFEPVNPDARIGSVRIGTTGAGNLTASDIVTGALPGRDGFYGTDDDTTMFFDEGITPDSRIEKVIIKGGVFGGGNFSGHYGIDALRVDSVKIGGQSIPLISGPANDFVEIGGGKGGSDFAINERLGLFTDDGENV
ncbi:MAG: hypothetical protein ABI680_11925 [Chthoniobacteraceae bacterium]